MLFDVSLFVFIFHLCGVSRCKASSASEPKVAIQDVSPDSPIADIVYLGEKQEVILFRTENGHVYRSPDSGLSWQKITDGLGQKSITRTTGVNEMPADSDRIKLIGPHPSDNNVVLLVGVKHVHYLSEDSGKSWRFIKHQGLHTYLFHPTDSKSNQITSMTFDESPIPSPGRLSYPPGANPAISTRMSEILIMLASTLSTAPV